MPKEIHWLVDFLTFKEPQAKLAKIDPFYFKPYNIQSKHILIDSIVES